MGPQKSEESESIHNGLQFRSMAQEKGGVQWPKRVVEELEKR